MLVNVGEGVLDGVVVGLLPGQAVPVGVKLGVLDGVIDGVGVCEGVGVFVLQVVQAELVLVWVVMD